MSWSLAGRMRTLSSMEFQTHDRGIFIVDGVLSALECEQLVGATEATGYESAPITTPWGFEMRPEIRNNTRVMEDDHDRAGWLWDRLARWIPRERWSLHAVGLNERFRYYRYHPGQYFEWHRDGAYRRNVHEVSQLTLMVYLNGDFEGGQTEFEHAEPVRPRQGRALVFEHGLRHRGAPVDVGTKYVMRTDVMYRGRLPD